MQESSAVELGTEARNTKSKALQPTLGLSILTESVFMPRSAK